MPSNKGNNPIICKDLVWFICVMAYQLLMNYLMPKFDTFVNVFIYSFILFILFIFFA